MGGAQRKQMFACNVKARGAKNESHKVLGEFTKISSFTKERELEAGTCASLKQEHQQKQSSQKQSKFSQMPFNMLLT